MKYSILKRAFLALPVWLALGWGCTVSEKHEPVTPGIPGTDETQVTILVDVPGMETPSTRSIAGSDGEAEVKTVDILVFDNSSPAKLTEHAKAVNISNNVDTGIGEGTTGRYTVQFQAKLTANTNAASVMIVANASDEVDAAILAAGSNAEKQDLLAELTFASSNPGGTVAGWKWNATSSTNYTPIPMYGEKALSGITQGMRIDGIELVRMLARVDVVNNATTNFTLSEIYLVNYNTAGYIAPAWNTANGTMLSSLPVTPMLPASPGTKNGEVWAIPYTYAHNGGTGYLGEIYTYEAPATTGVDGSAAHTNAACLIVKGKLSGDTNDYYYRIDFTEGVDGTGKAPGTTGFNPATVDYMPIYRNHKYIVSIAAAEGVGHLQFFDALYSLGVMTNLKTSLHVVDESTVTNMVFDGQYYIGVGDDVEFSTAGGTAEVLAVTNYSTGWMFDTSTHALGIEYVSGGTGWLTATKGTETTVNGVVKANIQLSAPANPLTDERIAYVHIKAGRLVHKVKVVQEALQLVTVSPSALVLPYTAVTSATDNLMVVCTKAGVPDPTVTWTLTSNASWLTLSLNSDGSGASSTVSGTGDRTVYTVAQANTSTTTARTTTVTLNGTTEVATYVSQQYNFTGIGKLINTSESYVGAFWRADQTGERLISIPATDGLPFTVSVYDYGSHFQAGDIVFSTTGSSDPNIYTNNAADMNNSDATYQVTNGSTAIGNTVGSVVSGQLFFRIGLKTKWNASHPLYNASRPVRYATIIIIYNGTIQKLFLRQGHDPDYLMVKTDGSGNATISSRPLSNKYSPYNLTHPTFRGTASTVQSAIAPVQPSPAASYLTNYPSQAGAMYQWGPNYGSYAFNPVSPTTTPANWAAGYTVSPQVYWSTQKSISETCPAGYRRPRDTENEAAYSAAGTISDSEQRQSLWYNPQTSTNMDTSNAIIGYYADGFFDRRIITGQADYSGTIHAAYLKTAVSTNNSDVAYIGTLFYNPITTSSYHNASLFFPKAGYRIHSVTYPGYIYTAGGIGYYWTSSAGSNGDGWSLDLRSSTGSQRIARAYGYSIRCVTN